MNSFTEITSNLYADGGFPHIRLCYVENIEEDKKSREFSSKNIMSIQNILNRRRNNDLLFPKRTTRNINNIDEKMVQDYISSSKSPDDDNDNFIINKKIEKLSSDSDSDELQFKFNKISDKDIRNISNLNVSKILKRTAKKGSKRGSKRGSKKN